MLVVKEAIMSATTVPVTVTPEADRFLDECGLRPAYDQLLEYAQQIVPRLRSIEVTFHPYCGDSCEEFVAFHAFSDAPPAAAHEAADDWMKWAIKHFPYEVNRHFILFALGGAAHAR
jgi:hypothetical protein